MEPTDIIYATEKNTIASIKYACNVCGLTENKRFNTPSDLDVWWRDDDFEATISTGRDGKFRDKLEIFLYNICLYKCRRCQTP